MARFARSGFGSAPYDATINAAAQRNGLDPDWFRGQLKLESGFDPSAVSSTGAIGIGQVLPSTAANPGYGLKPLSNPWNPYDNINFSADYLGARIKANGGDFNAGVRGYSGGEYGASSVKATGTVAGKDAPDTFGPPSGYTGAYQNVTPIAYGGGTPSNSGVDGVPYAPNEGGSAIGSNIRTFQSDGQTVYQRGGSYDGDPNATVTLDPAVAERWGQLPAAQSGSTNGGVTGGTSAPGTVDTGNAAVAIPGTASGGSTAPGGASSGSGSGSGSKGLHDWFRRILIGLLGLIMLAIALYALSKSGEAKAILVHAQKKTGL